MTDDAELEEGCRDYAEAVALVSAAISLKRIADCLDGYGDSSLAIGDVADKIDELTQTVGQLARLLKERV